MWLYLSLPSFFHQRMPILIVQLNVVMANSTLSIINIMLHWNFFIERIVGISKINTNPRKVTNVRKLHINLCEMFSEALGHNPITFKANRFKLTAHSKSTCRNLNKWTLTKNISTNRRKKSKMFCERRCTKYTMINKGSNSTIEWPNSFTFFVNK